MPDRVTLVAWSVVALVIIARGVVAFTVPLTGDEAYYWEWSRHPALGYVDHPPLVAYTIALFSPLGATPGIVRVGFVLCGAVASLAIAGAVCELGGDARAGAIAALGLALMPLATLAFASASPDGPYMMFWALALWFGARAIRRDRIVYWALLGVALAGTVLSRVLGFALVFGVCAYALSPGVRHVWRRGLPLALGIAFALGLPWLYWNATHGWITLAFALFYRHDETHGFSLVRLGDVLLTQAAAYSPGIFAAVLLLALRPRNAFLAWTALPQLLVVTALGLIESVEVYWIFGAMVSMAAMLGVAYGQIAQGLRVIWTTVCAAPGALLVALILTVAFAPVPIYRALHRETGLRLRNGGPFEIMTYAPLARQVAPLAQAHDAVVMTDGYGFSSVLDFDAGITPVVIGYDWQGREARRWYPDARHPARALFVDKEPLASRPDIARHLQRACTHVRDGGVHAYSYAGTPPRDYYFTWCDGLVRDGLAILRWEREPSATAQVRAAQRSRP
ncbi:MAG: glycosyltransferase family 39 protein [Candidatus Eremiobacteraeota bacterium]|nr:glycosyltransferase family 39 protein [Candidatus Eremiobacteraeota bacterium]